MKDGFYKQRRSIVHHDFRFDWCHTVDESFPPLNCTFTWDSGRMSEADAVWFHQPVSKLQNGTRCDELNRTHTHQYWVWSTMEAPEASAPHSFPCARHFNVSMTVAHDADVHWVYNAYRSRRDAMTPARAPLRADKPLFALWIVSNCHPTSSRDKLVQQMIGHMPIKIEGTCARNFRQRSPRNVTIDNQQSHAALRAVAQQYLFYLAFENSLCDSYITEKAWHWGLEMGAIPVVYGGKSADDYSRALPPNSFIDASTFGNASELVAHLHRIATDESLFATYHAWRTDYELMLDFRVRWDFNKQQEQLGMCRLCHFLQTSKQGDGALRPRTLSPTFYTRDTHCRPPPPFVTPISRAVVERDHERQSRRRP